MIIFFRENNMFIVLSSICLLHLIMVTQSYIIIIYLREMIHNEPKR